MPATLSTVDAILKDDYKEYLDNLNNANFILSQVETRKDTVQGRIARHAVHSDAQVVLAHEPKMELCQPQETKRSQPSRFPCATSTDASNFQARPSSRQLPTVVLSLMLWMPKWKASRTTQ